MPTHPKVTEPRYWAKMKPARARQFRRHGAGVRSEGAVADMWARREEEKQLEKRERNLAWVRGDSWRQKRPGNARKGHLGLVRGRGYHSSWAPSVSDPFSRPCENLERALSPIKHTYSYAQKFCICSFSCVSNLHSYCSAHNIYLAVRKDSILLCKVCFITLSSVECIWDTSL